LGFYKHLGVTTILDDEYLLLWHFEGETQKPLPCNYPDVIINSVDVIDVEPRKNYLDEVHRQFGLEKTNPIESDEQSSKPINPEKDIPVFFEIQLIEQGIEWELADRSWTNTDEGLVYPAKICSHIIKESGAELYIYTILEDDYSLSDMVMQREMPNDCAKFFPVAW